MMLALHELHKEGLPAFRQSSSNFNASKTMLQGYIVVSLTDEICLAYNRGAEHKGLFSKENLELLMTLYLKFLKAFSL